MAKGFEQLGQQGSDKMVLRLGGIYALEGVMNGSELYHQPVLEALCAFVRDGTKTHDGEDPPATDIQAALTVILRRRPGTGNIDLRSVRIPNVNLVSANLTGANLIGADLHDGNLAGVNLTNANLHGADLTNVDLNNADLTNANLHDAHLASADLTGARLQSADLTGVRMTGFYPRMNDYGGIMHPRPDAKISQAQLDEACGVMESLPRGLVLKKLCPK